MINCSISGSGQDTCERRSSASPRPPCDGTPSASVWPSPRPPMPVSFRKDSSWRNHEACGRHSAWTSPSDHLKKEASIGVGVWRRPTPTTIRISLHKTSQAEQYYPPSTLYSPLYANLSCGLILIECSLVKFSFWALYHICERFLLSTVYELLWEEFRALCCTHVTFLTAFLARRVIGYCATMKSNPFSESTKKTFFHLKKRTVFRETSCFS